MGDSPGSQTPATENPPGIKEPGYSGYRRGGNAALRMGVALTSRITTFFGTR
jgi:hypothetical protein